MFRTILVPLAGTTEPGALEDAATLARSFGAHLVCLHVRTDSVAYMAALTGGGVLASVPEAELIDLLDRDAEKRGAVVRHQFEAFCDRRNIPVVSQPPGSPGGVSAELRFEVGDAADAVAAVGRVCDLVVMRRPADGGALPHGVLNAALFETGRPLLLAGPRPVTTYDRIAVGWRPGREAAQAVAAAAPFLGRAKAIEVICVDADAEHRLDALRLVDGLRWRGLRAAIRPVISDSDGPGEALLAAARNCDSDLLVMGGFGRSRFRQFVLGGVSRHVLRQADCAVLLAH